MPLSQTVCLESVWSLYLLLGSMGPILTMSKFFWGRGLLSSLGIKESKAPGFMKPAAPCISKEHFKAPKALWRSSTLSFLSCLSLIISWLVRILGWSYKWMIFLRQSYLWQESWFFFPGGCWHHAWVRSILSFLSFSIKNWLWPDEC